MRFILRYPFAPNSNTIDYFFKVKIRLPRAQIKGVSYSGIKVKEG
jgi:hypothetical protein